MKKVYGTLNNSRHVFTQKFSGHVRILRGDRGPDPPEKSQKYRGFLTILVRITCKTTKLTSQPSVLGHHRPASETPFKWHFAGWPTMAPL